jgi:hypothetical protein
MELHVISGRERFDLTWLREREREERNREEIFPEIEPTCTRHTETHTSPPYMYDDTHEMTFNETQDCMLHVDVCSVHAQFLPHLSFPPAARQRVKLTSLISLEPLRAVRGPAPRYFTTPPSPKGWLRAPLGQHKY